jgi:hypothetical protein
LDASKPEPGPVTNAPIRFGYNEATRQFDLPPLSGRMNFTLFAGRATLDTGLKNLLNEMLFDIPGVRQVSRQEVQESITIDQDAGCQFSQPLPECAGIRSTLSEELHYKTDSQYNYQTNIFTFSEYTQGVNGNTIERISHVYTPTPATDRELDYLPLAITLQRESE